MKNTKSTISLDIIIPSFRADIETLSSIINLRVPDRIIRKVIIIFDNPYFKISPEMIDLLTYPDVMFIQNKENLPDASGKLPTGETFKNYSELKEILMTSQKEKIIRNSVERTLSYAMCRKLTRNDQPTVDRITKNIVKENGTWKDLFVEIVNSLPFRETIFTEEIKG